MKSHHYPIRTADLINFFQTCLVSGSALGCFSTFPLKVSEDPSETFEALPQCHRRPLTQRESSWAHVGAILDPNKQRSGGVTHGSVLPEGHFQLIFSITVAAFQSLKESRPREREPFCSCGLDVRPETDQKQQLMLGVLHAPGGKRLKTALFFFCNHPMRRRLCRSAWFILWK